MSDYDSRLLLGKVFDMTTLEDEDAVEDLRQKMIYGLQYLQDQITVNETAIAALDVRVTALENP